MKIAVEYGKLAGKEFIRESVTPHEGAFLMQLIDLVAPLWNHPIVVEIGSWIGVSTIYLAKGIRPFGGRVVTVDPHAGTLLHRHGNPPDTEALLRENLKRFEVEGVVEVIRNTSLGALEGWSGVNIAMLFLDGSHWFKDVRADFFGWSPWIHSGGVVAFHDYPTRAGVRKTVDGIVRASLAWEELGREQKLIAFRRRHSEAVS